MKPFLTLLTALLLVFLSVLHAGDAPSKQNAGDASMLAGDWVPEDPHQINYEKLPRVKAEHTIISDVRDRRTGSTLGTKGRRFTPPRIWSFLNSANELRF